jgi:hypothetical protein
LSKDELFAASQAQVIYIMMLVIEGGMRRLEWVQEMLMLSGVSYDQSCGGIDTDLTS